MLRECAFAGANGTSPLAADPSEEAGDAGVDTLAVPAAALASPSAASMLSEREQN